MITIRPYVRCDGIPTFRDSELVALYNLMVRDCTEKTLFPGQSVKSGSDFVMMAKSKNVMLFVALDGNNYAGFGYLNGFENGMARAHFCIFSEYWGAQSVEVGREMVEKAIQSTGLDMLVGLIPSSNRRAILFSQKCGARLMPGMFPYGSVDDDGKPCSTAILYYMR